MAQVIKESEVHQPCW